MDESPPASDTKVHTVLETVNPKSSLVPASSNLMVWNDEFLRKHQAAQNSQHVQAGLKVRQSLNASTKSKNEQDLIATVGYRENDLEVTLKGLSVLKHWESGDDVQQKYLDAARKRWPAATALKAD